MKAWVFVPAVCGLGSLFLCPCSSPDGGNSYPSEIRGAPAEVEAWMRVPKQPVPVIHDGSLNASSLFRESDLPAAADGTPGKKVLIRKKPYVAVNGNRMKVERATDPAAPVTRLLARDSCRFSVVDSRGFYSGIAEHIQYSAASHDLILKGSPIVKTGNRTLTAGPQVLMRVDLATGRIFANGPVSSQDSPL